MKKIITIMSLFFLLVSCSSNDEYISQIEANERYIKTLENIISDMELEIDEIENYTYDNESRVSETEDEIEQIQKYIQNRFGDDVKSGIIFSTDW